MVSVLIRSQGIIDHNGELVGDSLLIENGKIKVIGSGLNIKASKELNVKGFVLPAFIDAHLHLAGIGLSLSGVDLRGVGSIKEMLEKLKSAKGPIIFGRGWDQERFKEKRYPTRKDLDSVASEKPIVAVRICGHVAVLNTYALNMTRPWEKYPDYVNREEGLVFEDAVGYVIDTLISKVNLTPLIREAAKRLFYVGLGGVSSMSCSLREFEALLKLDESNELPIYVACYATLSEIDKIIERYGKGPGRKVSLVGLKLFSDGSLGARTAFLREPYADDQSTRGRKVMNSSRIALLVRRYSEMGFRIATHAIGDAALDEVIEGYSVAGIGERGRIEHVSVAWDEQIKKISELGVYAVVQPRFRVSDWWIDKRLGDRYVLAYRFRSMLKSGVKLALSTDSPVEPFDPVETFKAAVGRCDAPACRVEESLRPREVISLYTIGSAKASGGPVESLGRIEKDSPALLAWTPSDPLKDTWNGPLQPLIL